MKHIHASIRQSTDKNVPKLDKTKAKANFYTEGWQVLVASSL